MFCVHKLYLTGPTSHSRLFACLKRHAVHRTIAVAYLPMAMVLCCLVPAFLVCIIRVNSTKSSSSYGIYFTDFILFVRFLYYENRFVTNVLQTASIVSKKFDLKIRTLISFNLSSNVTNDIVLEIN